MARAIQTRWKINGTLKAETPIYIGGMGGNADTDLALAVNGCGNYYIPGTSLAGALRGWMSKPFREAELKEPNHSINHLWGFQDANSNGHASFIVIEDAEIKGSSNIEIREGVGIDRHTGAAADKAKYSRAILPKGVTFPLSITLDCQQDQTPDELWKLLLFLEDGKIRIGGAKTRGLGKVKLEDVKIEKHILNIASGLFDSLLKQNLQQDWQKIKAALGQYYSPAELTLTIAWQPKDPVMVKTEGDGIAIDILPLVSQVDTDVKFVIPGSSIKGVLRTHAERIVRTVIGIDITHDREGKPKFNEQIKLYKANKPIELVDAIFGSAEKSKDNNSEGKIGALYIDDCHAAIPMTAENWSAVENASSMMVNNFRPLVEAAIDRSEDPYKVLQPAMHVAVDRWTGGAAEGMLYSVLEPIGVSWETIGLYLDLDRLQKYDSNLIKPAIALLLLVLRDFANRKIPIGYGTNRGMGTVEVTKMMLNGNGLTELEELNGAKTIAPDLLNLSDSLLDDLTKAWKTWIKKNLNEAA
ncbi:RAMP superfamily CRISPR-associated protein [Geitlerinema splendidum]|nr:RAMP superfamily CRISPR-associated protein [Geitlerinema splendidum]